MLRQRGRSGEDLDESSKALEKSWQPEQETAKHEPSLPGAATACAQTPRCASFF